MELPPPLLLLLHPLLLSQLLLVATDVPAHGNSLTILGCYWTESCQSKWVGGCGAGHLFIDQSEDCKGLCPQSKSPPCLPFYSHFLCCIPENPTVTNSCMKCRNKLDFGDEYLCCTDCSEPSLINRNTKLGYCKTGAKLSAQLKPQESFKWVAGTWMKCSSPCDGGIRYRDVGCFGSMDDVSIKHYPVDDSRCSGREMPARQEPCNVHSCGPPNDSDLYASESDGLPGWLVGIIVILVLAAFGGLAFVGFAYYKRRNSSSRGFVYIMMEGYA